MKAGISIMVITLLNMTYLELGGIIDTDFLATCFVGGFIFLVMEILYTNFITPAASKGEKHE